MQMELCGSTLRMPFGEYEDDSGDDYCGGDYCLVPTKTENGC